MSDIHSRTVHRNPCAWHVIHWQSTAEVQETGSSQRILYHASHSVYTNRDGQKVYTTDVIVEEQEFAESKKAAGQQDGNNGGYSDAGDGFMNIPDGIDEELPFN